MKRSRYVNAPSHRESAQLSKSLYKQLFAKPFPKQWKIYYATTGLCVYDSKEIHLSAQTFHDGLPVLVHEFVHMEHPDWEHDQRFMRMEQKLLKRAYAKLA